MFRVKWPFGEMVLGGNGLDSPLGHTPMHARGLVHNVPQLHQLTHNAMAGGNREIQKTSHRSGYYI